MISWLLFQIISIITGWTQKAMNIIPLGDRVVLKQISAEETTKAGIVLPATVEKEKPEQGEVVAVGKGRMLKDGKRAPLEVKVGD